MPTQSDPATIVDIPPTVEEPITFNDLPPEVIDHVFSFLDNRMLVRMALVDRRSLLVSEANSLWRTHNAKIGFAPGSEPTPKSEKINFIRRISRPLQRGIIENNFNLFIKAARMSNFVSAADLCDLQEGQTVPLVNYLFEHNNPSMLNLLFQRGFRYNSTQADYKNFTTAHWGILLLQPLTTLLRALYYHPTWLKEALNSHQHLKNLNLHDRFYNHIKTFFPNQTIIGGATLLSCAIMLHQPIETIRELANQAGTNWGEVLTLALQLDNISLLKNILEESPPSDLSSNPFFIRNKEQETLIHLAVQFSSTLSLQYLLSLDAQLPQNERIVDLPSTNKNTPLHNAITSGNEHSISLLLEASMQPIETSLLQAVETKNLNTVEMILQKKPYERPILPQYIKPSTYYHTPKSIALVRAMALGVNNIAKRLIEEGADIFAQELNGSSALSLITENNNTEMFTFILDNDPDLFNEPSNDLFLEELPFVPPKNLAQRKRCVLQAERFIEKNKPLLFDILWEKRNLTLKPNLDTLLKSAAKHNRSQMEITFILQHPYPERVINAKWGTDKTAVLRAINQGSSIGVSQLLDLGAELPVEDTLPSFHRAIRNGYNDLVKLLIEKAPSLLENEKATALELAVDKDHRELWEAILNTTSETEKENLLDAAVKNHNFQTITVLLQAGAKANNAMLLNAIDNNKLNIVTTLLNYNASLAYSSDLTSSPLMHVIKHKDDTYRMDIMKQILSKAPQQDPNILNEALRAALNIENSWTRTYIAKMLIKQGASPTEEWAHNSNRLDIVIRLLNYIEQRKKGAEYLRTYSFFGIKLNFGFSKDQKLKAAEAFKETLLDDESYSRGTLRAHQDALNNGELAKIYHRWY